MKSDVFRFLASRRESNLMRTKNRSGSSRCRYVLLDIGSRLIEFKGTPILVSYFAITQCLTLI